MNELIYKATPNHNTITFKCTNKIPKDQQIKDDVIEQFDVLENITATSYSCNITSGYIQASLIYPIFYTNIVFSRPLRHLLLARATLYSKTQKHIDPNNYDAPHPCIYYIELTINDKKTTLQTFDTITDISLVATNIKQFLLSPDMKQTYNAAIETAETEFRKSYDDDYSQYTIPVVTKSLKDYESDSE